MGKDEQAGFSPVEGLLILVIVAILGGAGWYVYDANKKANNSYDSASKSSNATPKAAKKSESKTAESKAPSQATLDNIKASITSKNTAALEGYMAASVNVILAASEAYGPQTPAQAVKDVDYVSGGTEPWNFALPAATLAQYQAGDYKQYFPASALVGKSANDYVISFQFDSAGKINGIFMTNTASVL
jgi:uncharacterized protein HemX